MFTLRPLTIVLPSREDKNHPVIDLDLHLPLLCFKSRELLQVKYKCWWLNMETTKIEGFSLLVVWVNRRSENPNQSNLDKKKCKRLFLNGCTFWLNKSVTENFGPHHIGKMFYVSVLCLQIIASILTEQRMVFFSSGLGQTDPDHRVFHAVYLAPALAAPTGAYTVSTYAWLCYGTDCLPHGMPHQPLWGRCQGKA